MHLIIKRLSIRYILALSLAAGALKPIQIHADSGKLTFPEACRRAIASDPFLKALEERAEAASGEVEQAGRRPNPMVGVELENFLGTGSVSGIDSVEVTLGIRQVIETAKKRERRKELAETGQQLIVWEREMRLADLEARVRNVFVEGLLAQAYVRLREEELELARQGERETERLMHAARAPQVEHTRARLAVRQQQFALDKSLRELESAKLRLASLWAAHGDLTFQLVGDLAIDRQGPGLGELIEQLPDTAQLARFTAIEQRRVAELELEKALSSSDIEVFAGGRYYNEADGDVGLVAGIELPWRLFNKNAGSVRSSRARLRALEYEREAARQELLIRLSEAYQNLVAAQAEVQSIQSDLLPVAEQTLRETSEGYERGQYTLLAVLESRRVLFEIREAHLDALSRYAGARMEIETLTRPTSVKP